MYKKHKFLLTFTLILTLLFGTVSTVCATETGSTSIAVSSSSVDVGDTITATIQSTASDTVTVSYNGSILTLTNCSASGYTTSGSTVTFTGQNVKLTFTAASSGTSYLSAKPNTLEGSSTNVTVAAAATEEEETTTSTTTTSTTSVDFTVDGTDYVVSERFSSDEIPAGFENTDITIHDSEYTELSNGTLTLVYLKPASDTSGTGTFFLYDAENDAVTALSLLGTMDHYVILQSASSLPTTLLTESTLTVEDNTYSAYVLADYEEDGFYFVYGVNENGTEGWFQYDTEDGSIQRLNTDLVSLVSTDGEDSSSTDSSTSVLTRLKNSRSAIAILIFAMVVLAIITINIKVFKSKNDEFDEDIEGDVVEEEPVPTREKRHMFARRQIEEDEETQETSTQEDVEDSAAAFQEKERDIESTVPQEDNRKEDIEEAEEEAEEEPERGGFFRKFFHAEEDIFAEDDTAGTIFTEDMSISHASNVSEDKKKNDKEDHGNDDLDVMDLNDL